MLLFFSQSESSLHPAGKYMVYCQHTFRIMML